MRKFILTVTTIVLFTSISNAQHDGSAIYVNDMDYVLGDVKQRLITNQVTTRAQADNLIAGFKTMKVNGIRIPIYAEGLNPNVTMYNYFYDKAVAEGFKIFANPAQHSGGQRIANGILDEVGPSVLGKSSAKNALVDRIKDFAGEYPCDWICPFNEDGAPGAAWYANQFTNVYSELYGNVNGADLVGPCAWGIPASLQTLEDSNIKNYITVATTHNLGFNHNSWGNFINEAESLPVWDSEVNNFDKFGTGSRLEAAIDAGVDGLVLYNSGNTINLTDGSVDATGQGMMDLYLKFRTDKIYYIDCVGTNKRLAATGSNEDAYGTSTNTTGANVEWKFVHKGNGYYHIQRAAGGSKPRLRSDNTDLADMQSTKSNGTATYYNFSSGFAENSYHLTLPNYPNTNKRLQITDAGVVKMVTTSSTGSWVSFRLTEADTISGRSSQSSPELVSIVEYLPSLDLMFPSLINSSNPEFKTFNSVNHVNNYELNIFNLSGQNVFKTSDIEQAWIPLRQSKGIFVYQVDYIDDQNIQKSKMGKILVE